jgi:predicted DNA-binding transcriptional regulator YafY
MTESPDPDGWVTLHIEFDDEDHATFYAQGLGARGEVVEPPALRARVVASAAAVIARERVVR